MSIQLAANYRARNVKYVYGGDASTGGTTSDCSHFVHDVLSRAGIGSPLVTAKPSDVGIANSGAFQKVNGPPQAGDIIVEKLGSGADDWHMGIYLGTKNPQGAPVGMQMGVNHGVGPMPWKSGPWGTPGFYRPQK
jgi:cell wall-associated NlpC family hydrolase